MPQAHAHRFSKANETSVRLTSALSRNSVPVCNRRQFALRLFRSRLLVRLLLFVLVLASPHPRRGAHALAPSFRCRRPHQPEPPPSAAHLLQLPLAPPQLFNLPLPSRLNLHCDQPCVVPCAACLGPLVHTRDLRNGHAAATHCGPLGAFCALARARVLGALQARGGRARVARGSCGRRGVRDGRVGVGEEDLEVRVPARVDYGGGWNRCGRICSLRPGGEATTHADFACPLPRTGLQTRLRECASAYSSLRRMRRTTRSKI